MRARVLAFFFVSGFCGLLYEVVWIRAAGTVIGNTTHALGTVVGVFMGGLALGGWWGGRQADCRSRKQLLRFYGILEGAVAGSALLVPVLLSASEPLFRALWNGVPSLYGSLRILLVGLLLLVPTTLMGATLPVLARFLSSSIDSAGREAGRAYATNTLGGVLGTLAAGFWLVPEWGLHRTTLLAAALNLGIAVAAWMLSRVTSGDPIGAPPTPAKAPFFPLAVAAGSGLASLLYEVAWTRSLVLALGSTVHAFTLILAAFILGLALGSAAASLLLPRLPDMPAALGGVQIGIGVLAIALLPSLGNLPLQVAPLAEGMRQSYGAMLWTQTQLIALFVLAPTFCMGAVFPLAIRWAAGPGGAVGRSVGAVYTANTLGSIVGSLLGSFALVPWLGLAATVKLAATTNLALAAVLLLPRRWPAAIPALAALLGWFFLPSWDPKVMASGPFLYGSADLRSARGQQESLKEYLEKDTELLAEYWDSYGLVTLHRQQSGILTMKVNGKSDASTGPTDRANMLFVGDLALLHHPRPRRALLIGLGGGLSLAAMAKHPLERLDCVELSPAVRKGADHFQEAIGRVLEDPRVHIQVGDGRNAILFGREEYDVIVSQPSNLWVSGMANLFTKEFFEEASRRLAPGGLFCQWVHAYWLSPENLKDVIRTFYAVYPEGSVWEVFPGHDYLLLGRREPVRTDLGKLEDRLGSTRALEDYVGTKAPRAPVLLGHLIADAAGARLAVGSGPLVTDDRCFLEYTAPRSMGRDMRPEVLEWLDPLRRGSPLGTLYGNLSDELREEIGRRRESRRLLAEAVRIHQGDPEGALEALERSPTRLSGDPRTAVFVDYVAEAVLFKAQGRLEAGDLRRGVELLRRIPAGASCYVGSRILLGQAFAAEGRWDDARMAYRAAMESDPRSFDAAAALARSYQIQKDYAG
ncbi:MAG TPA: fused MFS/spermidine synthase, partial [Planctomycetota bacterium]|nr:fused MFS/spermidine synthase [Planctomycetota bacterium]